MVRTVLEDIDIDAVGTASMHEHLFLHMSPHSKYPELCIDSFEKTLEEVQYFKEAGGKTVVDATPLGCGRAPDKLRDISEEAGINIVMATGSLGNGPGRPPLPAFPPVPDRLINSSIRELAEIFYKEIAFGTFDSTSRAGVIKVATSYKTITEYERNLLKAAAIASIESGAPITTHCQLGTMGLEQTKILKDMGVRPGKIIIGHLDLHPDIEYYKKIASEGVWIQFDRMGRDKYVKDSVRIELITQLVREGFESQMLFGSDMGSNRYWRTYNGSPGLDFMLTGFLRGLRENGMSESSITKITSYNPGIALDLES